MITLALTVLVDGRSLTATTAIAPASPHTCALETLIPDAGIELHSTYHGHPAQPTHATHLFLPDETSSRMETAVHRHFSIPVLAARQRCLLDHYAVLVDHAAGAGIELRLQVQDQNLDAIEQV